MPKWMHDRAEHILAKNPSMPKSEAFALATQQMHSLGKSPKGYGTAEGRAAAKAKFDTPKDDRKTANPGHLESPKMASGLTVEYDGDGKLINRTTREEELAKYLAGSFGFPKKADADEKFKLQGHTTFQGLRIAIENRKGSVRSGVDRDGKPWRTEMKHPYGYIKGTKGADGEEIDVYVGPDKKAPEAHVVHQHKSNGKGYDEDKVMLGFPSLEAARKAYLAHYNSPKFLGPISSMPIEVLKKIMHKGEKLVPPKSEHLDKVASAFFDELMKLAADLWDTATGGHSAATLQALAAKNQQPNFNALRQQWDQNAQHTMQRTDVVGQQVPAIRENLGKSDRQLEAEWAQRHVAQKEQAAAAANAAMPATGAHSPAAMRAQAPAPPAALQHAPTSVALPPMHPRAAGVGPGGGGAPALPQAARAAQGAMAATVKGPIIPRLPRPAPQAMALPAFHPKMKLGAIKEAITRSVREYQRGTPEQQAEIARASGQLGLKPRYVGDISEGGLEAGVDKMIGAAPGGAPAAMPSLQERLQGYKAQKAGLGLEGRAPAPGVIQSPQGRGILGVQAPASAPAAVPGVNESGVLVRKLYKPDSPLHRGEFTPQVLQQKQEFTDRARTLSPEARSMVPAMYGHQVLNADKGPELQRAVSFHEHVPQMTDVHGMNPQQVAAMKEHAQRTLLKPMEQQGMHMRDLISRKGDVNPGNLVMTPQGPKAIDFMPGDFRAGAGKSPMVSSMEKYVPSSEQSVFHEKGQLGQLRREVFNPQLRVQPGGALQGALPSSPLNKMLHPNATFVPEAARAAQGAMGKVLGKKPAVGAIGKVLAHA